eukprot:TRINITY_DN23086_c0_g2_i1.p1 TRINITY_DN23086_c0_g2~~TRINITY_DN23086_c0_g2_i1.p1  ORF type:complete len:484 (+),score=118.77 TRINITY_DN23086_c0_g2_i1:81-1532(+)
MYRLRLDRMTMAACLPRGLLAPSATRLLAGRNGAILVRWVGLSSEAASSGHAAAQGHQQAEKQRQRRSQRQAPISPLGAFAAVAGGAALALAAGSAYDLHHQVHVLQSLFHRHTTIEELQRLVEQKGAEALPKLCIVTGYIQADGADVQPYVAATTVRDLLVCGLLVTRQSCASSLVEFDAHPMTAAGIAGLAPERRIVIERHPRALEHTVVTARRVAEGLRLATAAGTQAALQLPPVEEAFRGEAPTPAKVVADVIQETRLHLHTEELQGDHLAASHTGLMGEHLLKFVTADMVSDTDSGAVGARDVLSDVGVKVPEARWRWHAAAYYDGCEREAKPLWASYPLDATVSFSDFHNRLKVAAKENNEKSRRFDDKTGPLTGRRDRDYGFRYFEFGIPRGAAVTVLAKPVASTVNGKTTITLVPPDEEVDGHKYRFRILQGHCIDDALHQRRLSELQYNGMVFGGLALMLGGLSRGLSLLLVAK